MPSAAWMRETVATNGAGPDLTDEEAFLDAAEAEARLIARYGGLVQLFDTAPDLPQAAARARQARAGARAHLDALDRIMAEREKAGRPGPASGPAPKP